MVRYFAVPLLPLEQEPVHSVFIVVLTVGAPLRKTAAMSIQGDAPALQEAGKVVGLGVAAVAHIATPLKGEGPGELRNPVPAVKTLDAKQGVHTEASAKSEPGLNAMLVGASIEKLCAHEPKEQLPTPVAPTAEEAPATSSASTSDWTNESLHVRTIVSAPELDEATAQISSSRQVATPQFAARII